MVCDIFINKLSDWLDGELDLASAREMEQHVEQCAQCRALAQEARALRDTLLEMGEMPVPQDLHLNMMAAVEKERAQGKKTSSRRFSWKGVVMATAAAAVLLVAVPLMGQQLLMQKNMSSAYDMLYSEEAGYGYYDDSKAYDDFAISDMAGEGAAPQAAATQAPSGSPVSPAKGLMDAADMDMAPANERLTGATGGESQRAVSEQKIIRSGSISMESRQFDVDVEALESLVSAYDGYMQNYSVSGVPYDTDPNSYGRWANMSVRIPSEAMDAFLADSKTVGNMLDTSVWSENITTAYRDTQLRLDSLRAQHTRLLELVAQAELVEDLIKLESELQRIQYEVDSLSGTLRNWDDKVDYATLDIHLSEVKTYSYVKSVDPSLGERISDAFYKSINGLVELSQDSLIGLVAFLPYLVLLVVIGGVVIVIVALRRRKKRKAAASEK